MSRRVDQFMAKDAFTYTDTYRKAVQMNASNIATEKERLNERYRRTGGMDSSYYAELRALEHAMSHLVKGEEPKRVLLGEADGTSKEQEEDKEAKLTARLTDLQRMLSSEKENKEKLKRDLKTVSDAYSKLQAEVVELRNITARLRRKIAQTSSTFGVVVFSMAVVIVVLLTVING